MEDKMIIRLELTQEAVNIIVEELNIQGLHQSLVDDITEQSEMQQCACNIYCGKNKK